MCGEQSIKRLRRKIYEGSPPRVRGTGTSPFPPSIAERITPACAGNSMSELKIFENPEDHPRVCGEQ